MWGPEALCFCIVRPSVRAYVCVCRTQVFSERLAAHFYRLVILQNHTIAQGLQFSDAKDLREIRPGSPPTGAPNAAGVG